MTSLPLPVPVLLPLARIVPSPLNPRKSVDDELSAGLLARGQLQPVLVRPAGECFELVDGARRWTGARKAGLAALVAIVREMSDAEALDVMMETGGDEGQRPLTPLDQARGYHTAMRVMKLTQPQVAAHYRVSQKQVAERLALLHLPEAAAGALVKGEITPKVAYEIARVPDAAKREEVAAWVLKARGADGEGVGYRSVKAHVFNEVCRPLRLAPFDRKDAQLVPSAGACDHCPFNTSNDRETYGDIEKHYCLSPGCFDAKVKASRAAVVAREEKLGKRALPEEVQARVWSKEEKGLAWNAGYVELARQPAKDLLKREVAAALTPGSPEAQVVRVPTWRELCQLDDQGQPVPRAAEAPPAVVPQVWVGFNQDGHAVDLVKIEDALLAADENERAIFNAETIKRFHLEKGAETLKQERRRAPVKLKSEVEDEEPAAEEEEPEVDDGEAEADAPDETPDEDQAEEDAAELAALSAWSDRAADWITWAMVAGAGMPASRRDEAAALLRDLGKPVPPEPKPAEDQDAAPNDPELYAAALEVLKSTGKTSTAVIQRRLRIGYNRASRLLEQMEKEGIVGPETGTNPREILVDLSKLGVAATPANEEALTALRIKAMEAFTAAGIKTPKTAELKSEVKDEAAQLEAAKADLDAAFEAAGIKSQSGRNRMCKFACGGKTLSQLSTVEEYRKLIAALEKKAEPKEGAAE